MPTNKLKALLDKLEFVNVATCDLKGRPNAAPKFLLKAEGDRVYLVDYIIGTTWKNVRSNPRASLSFVDHNTLKGYQLNASVKIIDKGPIYKKLSDEMVAKEIKLTAQHIIDDVRGHAKHENFEVLIRDKFVILELKVHEVVEIGISGVLIRERIGRQEA